MTAERRRQALRAHTERLVECVMAADAHAAVPTCPGWTVSDLVAHVGETQHWVADIIERRIVDPAQLPMEMAVVPTEPDDWPAWLSAGAARATEACSDEALEAPVFNAAADDRTGGQFWLSSLLNEAVIHGADAASAAGVDYEVDADVASDLITNHLRMLTSPTWAAQRPESAQALRGAGETLHWHATDAPALTDGDWFIERGSDGATWRPRPGEADVSVSGPAESLLLILTRRRQLADETDRVTVEGDVDLVRHWVEHSAHVAD
jgi:uncharacterized protein (TIGR03083 family)